MRDDKEIVIKTTTTQSYTKGKSLKSLEGATQAQLDLRKAWLNG